MNSDAIKNCRKKGWDASSSINGAHRSKKTSFSFKFSAAIFSVLALLHCIVNVSAQIDTVNCGANDTQFSCCDAKQAQPLHCLQKSFADRIKDKGSCGCALSFNSKVYMCKWNQFSIIKKDGARPCEFDPTKCPGAAPKRMTCLPNATSPPREATGIPYCLFEEKEVFDANKETGYADDELFYKMIFTCWLYDCEERLKLPAKSEASSGQNRWCYPKNFDGNVPKTVADEDAKKHSPTYCDRYKPSTASCARPPLCNENGKIDRSVYMVPLINGKVDYEYCEKLCPEEMTGASDPEGGVGEHNNDQCLIVPVCEDTGSGEVRPHNHDKHFIPHCVPMCDTDGQPRKHNVSAGFTVSTKTCIPLPNCDADGKPPPSGDENRFNAAECASPTAPPSTSQAVKTPFFTKDRMIVGAIALAVTALIGILILIGFLVYPCIKRCRARAKKLKEFSEPGEFLPVCPITDFHIKDTPPEFLAIERGTTIEDLFTFFAKFDAMVRAHGAKGGQLNFADYQYSLERAFVLYLRGRLHDESPIEDLGVKYVNARWEEIGAGLDYIGAYLKMVQASKEEGSTMVCRPEIRLLILSGTLDPESHKRVLNRLLYTPEAALAEIVHEKENRKNVEEKERYKAYYMRLRIKEWTQLARMNANKLRTETAAIEKLLKGWKPADGAGAAAAATAGKAKEQSKERVDMSASNSTDKVQKPPAAAPAAAAPAPAAAAPAKK